MSCARIRLTAFFLGTLLACTAAPSWGQQGGAMPSAEQLEMLRNLTREQREAVLRELGAGDDSDRPAGRPTTRAGSPVNAAEDREQRERRESEYADAGPEALPGVEPRFGPDDELLIDIDFRKPQLRVPPGSPPGTAPVPEPEVPMDPSLREQLMRLVTLVRSRNPYRLDPGGRLLLPGYPPFPLAGLTQEQATRRVAAEPSFERLELALTRLPLKRLGAERLKPFGYDMFNEDAMGRAATSDAPVPGGYVVGPGDEIRVQLYGSQNRSLRLVVSRDGRINFPELGPIDVGGMRFEAVRGALESRVQREMIGVRASVSIGDTRGIRVFVLGEVRRPGSHSVSGLATVTTALFAAGGVEPIGSLRDVRLNRQGAVVRRLDLYDLLLRGDTRNDANLMSGDVIFIPPVGATVTVDGEVRRPAIYELRGSTAVADVVRIAGGLTAEADGRGATLERVDEQGRRVVVGADVVASEGRSQWLRDGDVLRVGRVRPQLDAGIILSGHVHAPRTLAWRDGMRISDAIPSVDDLKPNADLGYVLIRRELPPDRRLVVLSADLSRALRGRGGEEDMLLNPRDQVTVFDIESGRERTIQRLLEDLRLQSRIDRPTAIVRVGGRVKLPGEYPLEPNMTISDLIRAGGNLSDAAYGGKAELTRYSVVDGEARRTELVEIDLARVLVGDKEADVALRPFDFLNVKEIPEWTLQEQVTLLGEVRFPGAYPIKRGETLRSVLQRAGGLTDLAFAEGAVFTRKDLREREQKQLDALAERLQNDLATQALRAATANQQGAAQAATVGQTLLTQLKATRAVGRLVIDVERFVASNEDVAADIVVQNGDTIAIPKRSQEVTVIGEVQNSTSHLYVKDLSRDDYIGLSGGMTQKADDKRVYIVRANGGVIASENSRWFGGGSQAAIKPGDTVVVPLDTERLPTLPLWQAVTQILYNLAIAAAAVNSF